MLRGFGTTYDLVTGESRSWYVDKHGVKRYVDNDGPVDGPKKEDKDNSNA